MKRRILAVVPDLMFSARIVDAARRLEVGLEVVAAESVVEACRAEPRPDLVIVDLSAPGDPLGLVRKLKGSHEVAGIPVLGFYPHVDQGLRRAAEAAGVDKVVPRSAFVARLGFWLLPDGDGSG